MEINGKLVVNVHADMLCIIFTNINGRNDAFVSAIIHIFRR